MYFEEGDDDTDGECKSCGSDCSACDDDETCTTCFDGFYLDDGDCEECPENCSLCAYSSTHENDAICSACATGYILENGDCSEGCAENCASCDY